jgi:hypothetical protein
MVGRIKIFILIVSISLISTGCQKTIFIPINKPLTLSTSQSLASHINPAEFYLCGNCHYPCQGVTDRWSGEKKFIKNTKEKADGKTVKKVKNVSK